MPVSLKLASDVDRRPFPEHGSITLITAVALVICAVCAGQATSPPASVIFPQSWGERVSQGLRDRLRGRW
jgi:hypothetical protein